MLLGFHRVLFVPYSQSITHIIIEERPRVCLSSALYNYILRHDKYSVTTHCQVARKVLQVSNIVFV